MTVSELISLLDGYDPDAEVRLMEQPSWPFEYSIAGVISRGEIPVEQDGDYEEDATQPDDGDDQVVFLLEGRQLQYGTKAAW